MASSFRGTTPSLSSHFAFVNNFPNSQQNQHQHHYDRQEGNGITMAMATVFSSSSPASPTFPSAHFEHLNNALSSSPRRSMSSIGGATSAMKNFLRRRRGTITSNVTNTNNDSIVADIGMESKASIHSLPSPRPSLTMQSFVFVGGYGVEPGTTMVLCDSEPMEGPPSAISSPTLSQCHSTIFASGKDMSTTAISTEAPPSSFSQAMMNHFNSTGSPSSQTSSFYRRVPSHRTSMISDTPVSSINRAATSTCAVDNSSSSSVGADDLSSTAASTVSIQRHSRPNKRSLSVDSLQSLNATAFQGAGKKGGNFFSITASGSDDVFQAYNDPFEVFSSTDPFEVLNDSEGGGGGNRNESEQAIDMSIRAGSTTRLSWVLSTPDIPAESFRLQSEVGVDDKPQEVRRRLQLEMLQKAQKSSEHLLWQRQQVRQQQERQQQRQDHLYRNSVKYLAGQLGNPRSNMPGSSSDDISIITNTNTRNSTMNNTTNNTTNNTINNFSTRHNSKIMDNSQGKSSLERAPDKERRRQSESIVSSKFERTSVMDLQDSALSVESIEKEIMVLRSKEIIIPCIPVVGEVKKESEAWTEKQPDILQQPYEDNILLVSSCSSPTQFYDAPQTRVALRTFLTATEREFDEMVEYGFPSKIFEETSIFEIQRAPEDSRRQQQGKKEEDADDESVPNCRYLTLRITLTPWHARADEVKLYGSTDMSGKQMQLKAMVHKFFSRAPSATVAVSSSPSPSPSPPSSRRVRSGGASRTSSNQSIVTVRSDEPSEYSSDLTVHRATPTGTLASTGSRPESISTQPTSYRSTPENFSRSPFDSPSTSRATSRMDSPSRDKFKFASSRTPSARAASRVHLVAIENASMGIRLLSPSSTRSPSPSPVSSCLASQPPRKGSLSALSLPVKGRHYPSSSSRNIGIAPMLPPRRKGSSPAIFFTPSNQSLSESELQSDSTCGTPSKNCVLSSSGAGIPPGASTKSSNSKSHVGHQRRSTGASIRRDLEEAAPASFSARDYVGRRRERENGNDINMTTSPSLSPTPSPSHLYTIQPQEKRRSSRYPFQLHKLHQEQVQQQQQNRQPLTMTASNLIPGNMLKSPWSPVSLFSPFSPTQYPVLTPNAAVEQIYDVDQLAGSDHLQREQQGQFHDKSVPSSRQGTKLFHFSSRDKKRSKDGRNEADEPVPVPAPPRLNAKSWRRREGGSGRSTQEQQKYEAVVSAEAVILAAAVAAASDNQLGCASSGFHDDTNRHEQSAEAYFETSMDNYSYGGGYGHGEQQYRAQGDDYHDHQAIEAAAHADICWRLIQCHQTEAMKAFAFP